MNEVTYYQAYIQAQQAIFDGKAMIKTLRKEGEKAAIRARRETVGTFEEKLAAVQAAWVPFNEQIAQAQAEITKNYEIADYNFEAYRGVAQ